MNHDPAHHDRRATSRRASIAERICWTSFDPAVTHPGWLNDLAPDSVAFVTPIRDKPRPGDRIEITRGVATEMPKHQSVRVVRTASYDRYFAIVGCRAETST